MKRDSYRWPVKEDGHLKSYEECSNWAERKAYRVLHEVHFHQAFQGSKDSYWKWHSRLAKKYYQKLKIEGRKRHCSRIPALCKMISIDSTDEELEIILTKIYECETNKNDSWDWYD